MIQFLPHFHVIWDDLYCEPPVIQQDVDPRGSDIKQEERCVVSDAHYLTRVLRPPPRPRVKTEHPTSAEARGGRVQQRRSSSHCLFFQIPSFCISFCFLASEGIYHHGANYSARWSLNAQLDRFRLYPRLWIELFRLVPWQRCGCCEWQLTHVLISLQA